MHLYALMYRSGGIGSHVCNVMVAYHITQQVANGDNVMTCPGFKVENPKNLSDVGAAVMNFLERYSDNNCLNVDSRYVIHVFT
jgi:hypothetical protein